MRNETAGCPALMNITRVSPWPFDVINRNLKAFQELLGWLKRNTRKGAYCLEHSILNWKDLAGNTILHVAALNDNNQVSKSNHKLNLNLNFSFATKSMKEEEQRDNFCIQVVAFATRENAQSLNCNMRPLWH
ncbi:hypothetical protein AAHE18_11G084900 [Arachis hypogaea]